MIVVYKVDRLTRSLADFAKLVEPFDIIEGARPPLRAAKDKYQHARPFMLDDQPICTPDNSAGMSTRSTLRP